MTGPHRSHSSLTTDLHRLLEQYTPKAPVVASCSRSSRVLPPVFSYRRASSSSRQVSPGFSGPPFSARLRSSPASSRSSFSGRSTSLRSARRSDRAATDYGESIANGSVNRSDRIDDTGTDANDPLEALKQRYAAGKLSEADFERRLDVL